MRDPPEYPAGQDVVANEARKSASRNLQVREVNV